MNLNVPLMQPMVRNCHGLRRHGLHPQGRRRVHLRAICWLVAWKIFWPSAAFGLAHRICWPSAALDHRLRPCSLLKIRRGFLHRLWIHCQRGLRPRMIFIQIRMGFSIISCRPAHFQSTFCPVIPLRGSPWLAGSWTQQTKTHRSFNQ